MVAFIQGQECKTHQMEPSFATVYITMEDQKGRDNVDALSILPMNQDEEQCSSLEKGRKNVMDHYQDVSSVSRAWTSQASPSIEEDENDEDESPPFTSEICSDGATNRSGENVVCSSNSF